MQRTKLDPISYHIQNSSKWMVHVEENLRINLHELRLGNDFLDTNQSTSDKRKNRST